MCCCSLISTWAFTVQGAEDKRQIQTSDHHFLFTLQHLRKSMHIKYIGLSKKTVIMVKLQYICERLYHIIIIIITYHTQRIDWFNNPSHNLDGSLHLYWEWVRRMVNGNLVHFTINLRLLNIWYSLIFDKHVLLTFKESKCITFLKFFGWIDELIQRNIWMNSYL